MTRFLFAVIGCVPYTTLMAPAVLGQENGVFTALRSDRLFRALGLREQEEGRVPLWPGQFGRVKWLHHATQFAPLEWSVYPTVAEARARINDAKFKISVGWRLDGAGVALGDEHYVFGRGESGTVLFRRANVVVHLAWEGTEAEALALAERIDALIRDDRQIAPRGTFTETPEIVDIGIPQTLTVRPMRRVDRQGEPLPVFSRPEGEEACIRIHPRFRGLGPVERLRFWLVIEGAGQNQGCGTPSDRSPDGWVYVPDEAGRIRPVRPSAENDGRFILELRVPEERITTRARAIAWTADNLIVTREVEVSIVPQR